jgi:hypothetical protein
MQGLVLGGLIVAVGLLLLLDNMGIVHAREFWRYWPLIPIAFGVSKILERRTTGALFGGAVITIVGVLFLLDNLDILYFDFRYIWPLGVIAFGLSMLVRSVERQKYLDAVPAGSGPKLNCWAVFSGGKRRIDSPDFQGGDILAIFGGFEIDLSRAGISSGRALIEINAIFGGVEIRVPENWLVNVRGVGIFGAFEDKTIPPRMTEGVTPPELVITGNAIFGGVNIKN